MKKLLVFLAVFTPVLAIAHTGHGVAESNGIIHLLLSHGYVVILGLIAVALSWRLVRKETKK